MLPFLYFILFSFIIVLTKSNFNSNPTTSSQAHQSATGTAIRISPDQDMIAVGFNDGTFKLIDMQVNQLCQALSTNSSQISQIIWLPSFGPVSFDTSNKIILWSTQCQITNQLSFNDTILRINYYQTTGDNDTTIGLIAINFQDRIQQYDIQTGQQNVVYQPPENQTFLEMVYGVDGEDIVLLASTSGSKISKFNTSDGSQLDSFDIANPLEKMVKVQAYYGQVIIGIAQNNNICRFDSAGTVYDIGSYSQATSISTCPTTKEFVLTQTQNKNIRVYLYGGKSQQSLSGLNGYAEDIDCSNNYLVSIDDAGFVNVYTYEEFKSWIIGLICGIVGGLVALVVGVIIFIKIRRRWAEQASQEKYASNRPKKYPRHKQNGTRMQSLKMLTTLQTTMRE